MSTRNDKQMEVFTEYIEDESVDRELKLSLILEFLYDGEISLTKAKELCTELGFFPEHWLTVNEMTRDIFTEINKHSDA